MILLLRNGCDVFTQNGRCFDRAPPEKTAVPNLLLAHILTISLAKSSLKRRRLAVRLFKVLLSIDLIIG